MLGLPVFMYAESWCCYMLYERGMASFTFAQKKFELIQKSHVPEPFVSRAKALPAKRSKKGYGNENEGRTIRKSDGGGRGMGKKSCKGKCPKKD